MAVEINFTDHWHGDTSKYDPGHRCVDGLHTLSQYSATTRRDFCCQDYTNLATSRNPSKALTPREAHDLCEAGFLLVVVWELLAIPGYFSNLQGQADGQYAYRYANEMIRQPENSAIYFAVDFDATQKQFAEGIAPYFEGIAQGFAMLVVTSRSSLLVSTVLVPSVLP